MLPQQMKKIPLAVIIIFRNSVGAQIGYGNHEVSICPWWGGESEVGFKNGRPKKKELGSTT